MIATNTPVVIMQQAELNALITAAADEAVRKYVSTAKATSNRPASVTTAQAAKMLGRSTPTVRKMIRAGTFRLNDLGQIPVEQIDRALGTTK